MNKSLQPVLLHTMDAAWRPNPLKAAILLETLKIPYEVKKWVSGSGPDGVEGVNFTRINPYGRTPAVEDRNKGVIVWESGAVLEYLLRTYDTDNVAGPGPSEQDRATFDEWNQVLLTGLAPAMGELAYFRRAGNADVASHFEQQIHRSLAVIEARLGQTGGFFMGSGFTAVDMNFYPWLTLWELLGLKIDDYSSLRKWLGACESVPQVSQGLKSIEKGSSG